MTTTQEVKTNIISDNKSVSLTRSLVESLAPQVRLTDSDGTLDLFCYVKCSPDDSDLIKNCRGVVFQGDKLVLQSFPYTMEYTDQQVDLVKQVCGDFSTCSVLESYEGALIRVFNRNGKWYVSTHRKLDAFHSKWASRESFGEILEKALKTNWTTAPPNEENVLNTFLTTLNPDNQYMFLVLNTNENRIVCQAPKQPTVYHVGTTLEDGKWIFDDNVGIPQPRKFNFQSVDELLTYVKNVDFEFLQGVIVFTQDGNHFKVLNNTYKDFFELRGNEPSIKFRYLQIRKDPKKTDLLYKRYPNSINQFDEYENILYEIANRIYKRYESQYIKRLDQEFPMMPHHEYQIMIGCHKWHQEDKKSNRVSLRKVIEVMNEKDPHILNQLIRGKKEEEKEIRRIQNPTTTQTPNKPKRMLLPLQN